MERLQAINREATGQQQSETTDRWRFLQQPFPNKVLEQTPLQSEETLPNQLEAHTTEEITSSEENGQQYPDKSGFEPFVIEKPRPQPDQRFVNLYGGNFAQDMRLNRRAVERVLQLAHLDGQVFLTTLAPSTQRSIEANPDGSVTSKRSLFWGLKAQETEEDNPRTRVTSIPNGWRIEINGQDLTEDLMKKHKGEQLKKAFVSHFNTMLKQAISDCVRREKLTSEKDRYFRRKLFLAVWPPVSYTIPVATEGETAILLFLPLQVLVYAVSNAFGRLSPQPSPVARKIDSKFEWVMPLVEIDKVIRATAYLAGKGRKLVDLNTS